MKNWKKAMLAAMCITMAGLPGMSLTTVMAEETTTEETTTALGEVAVVEGLTTVDGKIYYYENGKAVKKTWKTVDGAKYYFGKDGAAYMAGSDRNVLVKKIGSYYYGFTKKGKMVAGKFCTVKIKKSGKTTSYRYYFAKNGRAYAGKKTSTGTIKLAIKKISGKQYGFLPNGRMVKGCYYNGSKLYYFSKKGVYSASKTKKLNAAAVYQGSTTTLKSLLGTANKTVQVDSCFSSDGKEYLIYYDNLVLDVFRYTSGKEIFLSVMPKS